MIGKKILHYRIIEKLGEGGMGVVYKAEDTRLKRLVAIKMLAKELAAESVERERFLAEAQAAAALNHPNITTIYAIEEFRGDAFIVMEYIDGRELQEIVGDGRDRSLPIDVVLTYTIQIAEGLKAAHAKGITHRDIKSANIMVAEAGQVKIMDFGLAKAAGIIKTDHAGVTAGTIAYMSPEQVRGEDVDHRTDIWSFGVVLYEMLTREIPFKGEYAQAILYAILNEAPEPLPENRSNAPEKLQEIVAKALEKDREKRYQNIDDMLADLRYLQNDAGKTLVAPATSAPANIQSVAVLPFADMSPKKDQEYFCDGMTEELIDSLSKMKNWRVVSRTSAFVFKGKIQDVREIGQQLNVSHVLEGSVRKAGNRVRITAQLTNVADGFQIYSEKYDREMVDVFAIQDDIARSIVEKLKDELGEQEGISLVKHYTENSEAYQLYLKGRYFINKGTSKDTQKSIQYFEKALQKDARYALAYSGLADAYTLLGGTFSAPLSSWQTMPKAKAAAQKALDIDHTLAEAHTSMALVKFWYDWDWAKAEEAFKRAFELRSAYPRAFQWYAEFLSAMQRHDEAIVFIQKALDIDPLSVHITWHVGKIHFLARDYDAAITQCQKALEMDANFSPAFGVLRRVYELKGMAEETLVEIERISGKNLNRVNALRRAYEQSGWPGIWQKQLEWAKQQDTPPLRYAELYTQTGKFDRAFDWLEKAYEQRSSSLVYLNVFASFDPLRPDKRFKALLKKIGLKKN